MTKEELEKATGQELIEQRNYCGVDGYYGDYLDDVNAEMLKRFNHLEALEKENAELNDKLNNLASVAEVRLGNWQKCEKENKELKSIADFQTSSNMDRYFQLKRSKEKLTKAKSIIITFLGLMQTFEYGSGVGNFIAEAEQFLKE